MAVVRDDLPGFYPWSVENSRWYTNSRGEEVRDAACTDYTLSVARRVTVLSPVRVTW